MSQLEEWGKIVALVAGLLGLFRAIYEIGEGRKLRAQELRWKRANSAKELLDDIHNHELEKNAVNMLDSWDCSEEYEIAPGQKESISYDDVLKALAKNGLESKSDTEKYIRKCFDWFFYRVDRIQHYINRGLIDFDDVKPVFHIYAREMDKHRETYDAFLESHDYDLARSFLFRCK